MMKEKRIDIRGIRRQLGMTQEGFANALAVTTSTVNRWENDHTAPSRLARRAIEILVQGRAGWVGTAAGAVPPADAIRFAS
jgi:DNA-binding transcriptional regulator YiaG